MLKELKLKTGKPYDIEQQKCSEVLKHMESKRLIEILVQQHNLKTIFLYHLIF